MSGVRQERPFSPELVEFTQFAEEILWIELSRFLFLCGARLHHVCCVFSVYAFSMVHGWRVLGAPETLEVVSTLVKAKHEHVLQQLTTKRLVADSKSPLVTCLFH